tara:strand:- start:9 stop:245 length:237 start_codon:yes stop_codon:yes gene_type:complete
MREHDESEKAIREVRRSFNAEIKSYKERTIKEMLDLHPKFYDPIINFDNWKSGMSYLEENKVFVLNLLSQDKNDKENS